MQMTRNGPINLPMSGGSGPARAGVLELLLQQPDRGTRHAPARCRVISIKTKHAVIYTGLPERTARRVLNDTIAAGLLASATPKGLVSLRFPTVALDVLFPRLFPAS